MGAGQSSSSEMPIKKTLSSTIDYIAANYILSSNFQDLKNLTNQEYCKNLVILTSDVISQYLTTTEIEFLKTTPRRECRNQYYDKINGCLF